MDKLIIPPNSNWFATSSCYCTPDNGLIYSATSKIVFIPPKNVEDPAPKILDIKKRLNCFDINPEWNESKYVAVMNGENQVFVYNFLSGTVIKGHKGHAQLIHKQASYSSIVFTSDTKILSSSNSEVIEFCLNTNKFNVFPDFTARNPITIMKVVPNNAEMLVAGTKNGLLLLIDFKSMNIVSKFRGHDLEVTSLDFITYSPSSQVLPVKDAETKKPDDGDIFDIYSFEDVENEFGVARETAEDRSDDEETNEAGLQEKLHNTTDFNFLEECSTLKATILNKDECDVNKTEAPKKENFEQYRSPDGENCAENPSIDFSIDSNASSRTPALTEESLNFYEESQRLKDFVVVTPKVKEEEKRVILASGSRECIVWLWSIDDKKPLHKIKWHPMKKCALPAIFTNVVWINAERLLVTDNNGDIIEYKIKFDEQTKEISGYTKQKQLFDARGILGMCKSADNRFLWTISIHRNISCLEIETNQKIISLDTLQTRIHNIIENPIDSHVIAIGGNDKRLCLWNTSEATHHTITLKPFMNKIQSGVLALSWHPQKDNLIAFGTREGRIGVLDTNRATNVPIILESFSSHEVYSLAWAKFSENNGNDEEVIILLACSGGKLVYYSQKDYKLHHLKEFAEINSISTSEKRLALGTSHGDLLICDMSCEFSIITQRKLNKKYIGTMCWHGQQKLAIASESGVTLIRDVEKFINAGATAAATTTADETVTTLSSHKGRVYSVRFNKLGNQLVACSMHGFVNVWNLSDEGEVLVATVSIDTPAYTAIFMPNNESTIICGGQDSTVYAFEWQNYPVTSSTSSIKSEIKSIEWATISQVTTTAKHSKFRVKKKVKENVKSGNLEEVKNFEKLNLNTNKKNNSIFMAANLELSNNSLALMKEALSDCDVESSSSNKRRLNELIFGNQDDLKTFIDSESVKEIPAKSIATIVLPQLTDDLKKDIVERIASKSLMDVHVAVAPAVSYDLWRKSCLAYGIQLLENDDPIQAIPYLLAMNDIDTCIKALCEARHYREAFVIAKLRKEKDDPVFEKIMEKWIGFYVENGNYETAATLLCMKKDYKLAHDVLSKRQNMSSKCAEILELLSTKLSTTTTIAS